MAKGARSNSKKKLGSWKRNHLVPGWQEKADAARAAKLAECMAAPSVAPFVNTRELEENAQMEERGREGRKQKKPAAAQQAPVDSDQEMDEDVPMTKKGRKGEKGLHGRVQKKRRAGKLFMVGQKNQFHPKKKTTKTPINGRKRG